IKKKKRTEIFTIYWASSLEAKFNESNPIVGWFDPNLNKCERTSPSNFINKQNSYIKLFLSPYNRHCSIADTLSSSSAVFTTVNFFPFCR
ncbi:hypothetical protein L9F63_018048, partial [Diploptera punctata]